MNMVCWQKISVRRTKRHLRTAAAAAGKKKFELREELIRLAGEGCEELMFKPVSGEVLTKLTEIGNMIVDGQIRQATLKIDGTTFTLSGGEKIKVKRGYSYEQNGEIE